MVLLTLAVFKAWTTPPFSWWREAVDQAWIALRRCLIPGVISVFAFAYGAPGIEGGVISSVLGAPDRIGVFFSVGAAREFVPWVTGMVVAGVAGTAITADLGARRTREELDALAVMGVDITRFLIAPRVLALMVVMPVANAFGLVFSAFAGILAELTYQGSVAGYLETFQVGFTSIDIAANLIKTIGFGFIIGLVCSFKGCPCQRRARRRRPRGEPGRGGRVHLAVDLQLRVQRDLPGAVPRSDHAAMSVYRKRIREGVQEVGDFADFSRQATTSTVGAWHYVGEVIRQCGFLVTGTTLVIFGMVMIVGGECGLLTVYLLRGIGASSFAGFTTAICGIREMWPYMFAYVFAAKVGCGLVAEVGSMRIAEEIDTLEVMAVNPMRFVIATRLLAVWITVPFMYVLAIVFGTLGSYLVIIVQFEAVSLGQWITLHFQSQTLADNIFSLTKAMSFATTITLVGLYYGYRASGGPVGVGAATARSMVVNLVLIHVIGGALTAVFWGTEGKIPFGG